MAFLGTSMVIVLVTVGLIWMLTMAQARDRCYEGSDTPGPDIG